jgi:hypothetical protein
MDQQQHDNDAENALLDNGPPSAVADRLHLSEGDRLGWFYVSTILAW